MFNDFIVVSIEFVLNELAVVFSEFEFVFLKKFVVVFSEFEFVLKNVLLCFADMDHRTRRTSGGFSHKCHQFVVLN